MLSIGIVGLPNVGKSTLFNALTKSKQADAQNYPFCTIEPNTGIVEVPDERLSKLGDVSDSQKIVPTVIEFVDIAGLVKGASEGEGLGNKFLSHIREVDAIAHVVRSFEDGNVTHVHDRIDPKDDVGIINLELILADWQTVSARLDRTKKQAKGIAAKELHGEIMLLERVYAHLESGHSARELAYAPEEQKIMHDLHLLTMKPMLYVLNVDEQKAVKSEQDSWRMFGDDCALIAVCAKMEAELAELNEEDAREYMHGLGMEESGLDKIIKSGYSLLNLVTFFTSGKPETRAWTVTEGTPAPQAAGVIHTDFIKGFIKADVAVWQDFAACGGWNGVKEKGKLSLVGKEYIIKDGDVCYFHVAV